MQDKGNTDLIKYYIELYAGAFLLFSLNKYSAKAWLTRSSSPKILTACPALFTVNTGPEALNDPEKRGRVFELAVGAELQQLPGELSYWREKNAEVDFVYQYQGKLYAIEVKSGRKKSPKGLEVFLKQFPDASPIIITPENFPALSNNPKVFLGV